MTLSASCHCQGVRFRITGKPGPMGQCHCTRCRKSCGGVHHTTLTVRARYVEWVSGRELVASYNPEPPYTIVRDFCTRCGAYLGELVSGLDPLVVSAALLDGDPGRTPSGHEWVSDAVPWLEFDDGLPCFAEGYPEPELWNDPEAIAARACEPPKPGERTPTLPTPGSCTCGAVRYEVGPLTVVANCHCIDCRKTLGATFGTNGTAEDFRLVQGDDAVAAYESSPGSFRCFCRHCGASLFRRLAGDSGPVRVRMGTLDADPGVSPVAQVFLSQRMSWQHLADLPGFETAP